MNEFDLIKKYFNWAEVDNGVSVGVGDDGALVDMDADYQLVSSVDTLISGVHFPATTSAKDVAYKALAVNLSDLAAMGATPKYFTLALTLPQFDERWLADFSSTLHALSIQFNINLVGGDTTKGALSISINAMGWVKKNQALLRSKAKVGDGIFVSNTLGDAGLAFMQIESGKIPDKDCLQQFNRPYPQVQLGQKLVGIANACIDISDGLQQDLSHILLASKCGASIKTDKIPLSPAVKKYIKKTADWCLVFASGDDYQLCFTVPQNKIKHLKTLNPKLTQIGIITKNKGLLIDGLTKTCKSYQHF